VELANISLKHHQKEYKKGGNKMNEILKHAYYNAAYMKYICLNKSGLPSDKTAIKNGK
jgi:hypothetical protein